MSWRQHPAAEVAAPENVETRGNHGEVTGGVFLFLRGSGARKGVGDQHRLDLRLRIAAGFGEAHIINPHASAGHAPAAELQAEGEVWRVAERCPAPRSPTNRSSFFDGRRDGPFSTGLLSVSTRPRGG